MELEKKTLSEPAMTYYTAGTEHEKTVVMIHPEFGDHTCYDDQIAAFAAQYRILLPDLIGHGETPGGVGLSSMADYLSALLRAEHTERAVVIGFSLGAVLAQDFANKHPEAVDALCCFSAFDINHFDFRMFQSPDSLMGKIMMISMTPKKKFARSFKKYMAHTEAAQEKFYELNMQYDKKNAMGFFSLGKILNTSQPDRRAYPLCIGCGTFEAEDIKKANQQWHEQEPESTFFMFEEAGHLCNMDTPAQFNTKLLDFLSQLA